MTCYFTATPGGISFVCTGRERRGPPRPTPCAVCHRVEAVKECDWATGVGRTCDARLCVVCALHTDPDTDLCPHHGFTPSFPTPGDPFLLLVSGARRLVEQVGAPDMVKNDLRAVMKDAVVVITGDARGPDTWAAAVARELGKPVFLYALDGWIYANLLSPQARTKKWAGECPPDVAARNYTARFKAWCLYRNTVMGAHVARRMREGRKALAVGYLSPRPGTSGTEQTLGVCDRSALAVRRLTIDPQRELVL